MKIAALYARVSGEQQRDSNTIASQTEALLAHAERHGYHVAPDMVIEDDGFSGAVLERPGLERVRDLAAEGRIEAVLVHAPDRLSRRYAYQVLIIEELARQGVETVFLNAPSMETPEDHLLVQFQGMIAEYERAQILERSRRGKRHRARRGDVAVLSGAPYGYRYHRKTQDSDAFYEIVEPQASVVRDVYRHYTEDHMTIGAIARKLNERGVPTSSGRSRWERSVVWAMLRNPAYKGRACFGKTRAAPRQRVRPLRGSDGFSGRNSVGHERPREDWIEIPVPAIVSEETFALAEERLEKNKTFSGRRTKTPSVSQGLVACGKCGYALYRTSARTTARKISYYRCLGSDAWRYLNGPLCDSRPVRQDLLDDIVWTELVRLLEDPALVQAEIERRLEAARVSDPNQQREADLRHRLVRARKGIDRLVTAYQEELITIDELRDRTPELRRQEQALHRELESAVDRAKDRETYLRLAETLTGFLARLRSSAETLDIAERQRIVRLLVKEILVTEDKITIRHSIPIAGSSGGGPDPSKPGGGGPEDESCLLRSGRHISLPRQRLPALRARRLVPQYMAQADCRRRHDHRPLRGRLRVRLPARGRREALPPGPRREAGPLRTGTAFGEDPAHRVRPVRKGGPPTAWAGQAGDVRLPRHDALLRPVEEGQVQGRTQAVPETGQPHLAADQGGAAQAAARRPERNGGVAGQGHKRLAQLLCRPGERPIPGEVHTPLPAAALACPPAPVPKGPHGVGENRPPGRHPLAQGQNPPSVAGPTARRQHPREEPGALTRTPGSARGDRGNPVPYRDHGEKRWGCPLHRPVKSVRKRPDGHLRI